MKKKENKWFSLWNNNNNWLSVDVNCSGRNEWMNERKWNGKYKLRFKKNKLYYKLHHTDHTVQWLHFTSKESHTIHNNYLLIRCETVYSVHCGTFRPYTSVYCLHHKLEIKAIDCMNGLKRQSNHFNWNKRNKRNERNDQPIVGFRILHRYLQ